jgi:hypothetical protein
MISSSNAIHESEAMTALPRRLDDYHRRSSLGFAAMVAAISTLLVFGFLRDASVIDRGGVVLFAALLGFNWGQIAIRELWFHWPLAYHTVKFLVPPAAIPTVSIIRKPWPTLELAALPVGLSVALAFALVSAAWSAVVAVYWPAAMGPWLWLLAIVVVPALAWATWRSSIAWFFPRYLKSAMLRKTRSSARRFLLVNFLTPDLSFTASMNLAIGYALRSNPGFSPETASSPVALALSWIVFAAVAGVFNNIGALWDNTRTLRGALLSRCVIIEDAATFASGLNRPDDRQPTARVASFLIFLVVEALSTVSLDLVGPPASFWVNLGVTVLVLTLYYASLRWRLLLRGFQEVCRFYRDTADAQWPGQLTLDMPLATALS